MSASKPELLSALAWLVEAGADEATSEAPVDRFSSAQVHIAHPPVSGFAPKPPEEPGRTLRIPSRPSPPAAREPVPLPGSDSIGRAMEIAAVCQSLSELRQALEQFDGCTLKRSATKAVFADGTPDHGIMLIGEAPGREEDAAGLPFVGRAGQLLDKMLASIGLDRQANVYITNVINWRPPENRDPSPDEVASCLPFLRRHIELVSPKLIVLVGAVSVRHVLGRTEGIMRLRGKWLEYYVGNHMVPVMPVLHPAYLLRRPIDKRLAWRDLQEISAKVNLLGLLERRAPEG